MSVETELSKAVDNVLLAYEADGVDAVGNSNPDDDELDSIAKDVLDTLHEAMGSDQLGLRSLQPPAFLRNAEERLVEYGIIQKGTPWNVVDSAKAIGGLSMEKQETATRAYNTLLTYYNNLAHYGETQFRSLDAMPSETELGRWAKWEKVSISLGQKTRSLSADGSVLELPNGKVISINDMDEYGTVQVPIDHTGQKMELNLYLSALDKWDDSPEAREELMARGVGSELPGISTVDDSGSDSQTELHFRQEDNMPLNDQDKQEVATIIQDALGQFMEGYNNGVNSDGDGEPELRGGPRRDINRMHDYDYDASGRRDSHMGDYGTDGRRERRPGPAPSSPGTKPGFMRGRLDPRDPRNKLPLNARDYDEDVELRMPRGARQMMKELMKEMMDEMMEGDDPGMDMNAGNAHMTRPQRRSYDADDDFLTTLKAVLFEVGSVRDLLGETGGTSQGYTGDDSRVGALINALSGGNDNNNTSANPGTQPNDAVDGAGVGDDLLAFQSVMAGQEG